MKDVMAELRLFRGKTFETTLRCPCRIDNGESYCNEKVAVTIEWTHDDDTLLRSAAPLCAGGHTLDRPDDLEQLADQAREGLFPSPRSVLRGAE